MASNPKISPVNGQQVEAYWKLFMSFPLSNNPLNDDGANLNRTGQETSTEIFYLPANMGSRSTKKKGNLPKGIRLFIPIINIIESQAELRGGQEPTIGELHEITKTDQDSITDMRLDINGNRKEKQDLDKFRIHVGPFSVNIPPDGLYGSRPGESQAVVDGHFVITEPLNPDRYMISTFGRLHCVGSKCVDENFETDNFYDIEIA